MLSWSICVIYKSSLAEKKGDCKFNARSNVNKGKFQKKDTFVQEGANFAYQKFRLTATVLEINYRSFV